MFSFNIFASFFGSLLFIYRKMYLYRCLFAIAEFTIFHIISYFSISLNTWPILFLAFLIRILLGYFANRIYIYFSLKEILVIASKFSSIEYQNLLLSNKGGTNLLGTIYFILAKNQFCLRYFQNR
jgi:hypothetical protein